MARVASAQQLLAIPDHVDFSPPSFILGTGSSEVYIELTYKPTQRVKLNLKIGGPHAADFRWGPCDGGLELPPDDVCAIRVSFRPTDVGVRQAVLVVTTDAGTRTEIPLTGNA